MIKESGGYSERGSIHCEPPSALTANGINVCIFSCCEEKEKMFFSSDLIRNAAQIFYFAICASTCHDSPFQGFIPFQQFAFFFDSPAALFFLLSAQWK